MTAKVEWVDAGHPFFGVTLRRRGQTWNDEAASDTIPSDVAVVLAADDPAILFGSAAAVRSALTRALRLLDEHDAEIALAKGAEPCPDAVDGVHDWRLAEDGYGRTWHTTVHPDGRITAVFNGSADWTEGGEGTYIECGRCPAQLDYDPELIDYQ